MAQATFGAGCFWGVEAAFRKVKGVTDVAVGFMGGTVENPSYEEVSTGKTGHVEVAHVEYDPNTVSYEELLDIFWNVHDPIQKDRQGPDVGHQYRSVIYYHTQEQKNIAEESKKEEQQKHDKEVVTAIEKSKSFYKAEEYHQRYLEKHGKATC